ncbi:MAG: iron-containing redox enzyme family protein [Acidobacteriota bacterium]
MNQEEASIDRSAAHGAVLRQKIRLAEPWLAAVTEEFWNHPDLKQMLPEFFARVYASSTSSIEAMRVALERSEVLAARGDSIAAVLATYLEKHIEEEVEHPEWLLADLAVLGYDEPAVRERFRSAAIASLIGPQLYWIRHVHPLALLGFFAVLEGLPPTLEHMDEVEERTGYPRSAFRMMRSHATLDLEHADELFDLLDSLPLSSDQGSLLAMSSFTTLERVCGVFHEVLQLRNHGGD